MFLCQLNALSPLFVAVEKRCCERAPGDLAHLQAHETGEASESVQGANAPEEVLARHLCVSSQISLFH